MNSSMNQNEVDISYYFEYMTLTNLRRIQFFKMSFKKKIRTCIFLEFKTFQFSNQGGGEYVKCASYTSIRSNMVFCTENT
jgi:hypothetical protein